jgi:hypothetical protein
MWEFLRAPFRPGTPLMLLYPPSLTLRTNLLIRNHVPLTGIGKTLMRMFCTGGRWEHGFLVAVVSAAQVFTPISGGRIYNGNTHNTAED